MRQSRKPTDRCKPQRRRVLRKKRERRERSMRNCSLINITGELALEGHPLGSPKENRQNEKSLTLKSPKRQIGRSKGASSQRLLYPLVEYKATPLRKRIAQMGEWNLSNYVQTAQVL